VQEAALIVWLGQGSFRNQREKVCINRRAGILRGNGKDQAEEKKRRGIPAESAACEG
jgi:hypothetical protein